MTIRLELTPDLEDGLLAQAQEKGLSLEDYAEQVLRERVQEASSMPALTRSQIAGQRIRELRRGVTLGGMSIQELGLEYQPNGKRGSERGLLHTPMPVRRHLSPLVSPRTGTLNSAAVSQ